MSAEDALLELVAAYDNPRTEGRGRLLERMEEFGGAKVARAWAGAPDRMRRHAAARLMHLVPEEAHLPALLELVTDLDPAVRAAARRALAGQPRTPAWHEAVSELASSAEDAALQAAAAGWLATR